MKKLENTEPQLYTPFLKGKYTITPGFNNLEIDNNSDDYDKRIFQIDKQYYKYIDNKTECRLEDIAKYYQEKNFNENTKNTINKYIIESLINTYPEYFIFLKDSHKNILQAKLNSEKITFDENFNLISPDKYLTLFDAICSQVQEDIIVCQLEENNDYLSAIHLCSPSYWSAQDKIGMNFAETHRSVAGMEKMLINYRPLLDFIFTKGPYYRFAWEINADKQLNHHPETFHLEKRFNSENPELYVRVERQTIVGFSEIKSLLFTIRTYYTDVNDLSNDALLGLKNSLLSMSSATLEYKRITDNVDDIINWLDSLLSSPGRTIKEKLA